MLRRLFPERGTRLIAAERARARAEQLYHNLLVECMVLRDAKAWAEDRVTMANIRIAQLEKQVSDLKGAR